VAGLRRADAKAVSLVSDERVTRPAVAAAEGRPAASGLVVVPRTGLVFPRRLPFAAWLGIGAQLAAVATSSAWCLGDWLVYGQAAYGGRYRDAIERTGLDYQTLRNYAWVAGRFELSRRRDTLSFGHHAEVAALPAPEQDFWLRKAEEFHWSTMRLRREVRASLAEREHRPLGLEPAGPATCQENGQGNPAMVRVSLARGALELCERAADLDGMTLHAWAAQTLERAARRSLQRLACGAAPATRRRRKPSTRAPGAEPRSPRRALRLLAPGGVGAPPLRDEAISPTAREGEARPR
jgi:hypothetical protein